VTHEILSFSAALSQWLVLHTQGRKPRSIDFNEEIHAIILREWPGYLNASRCNITRAQVLTFAGRVTRYCPSRWNAIVCALRYVTSEARILELRPLRSKERPVVSSENFKRLVAELEQRERSHGALVVQFLAHTGLRINEARCLKWSDVQTDFLLVPGSLTKNGERKAIPFVNGMREVLDKLRAIVPASKRPEFILPQRECKTALTRACRVLGIPHLAHHDFRHLFATRCIESGVDLPTTARWMGHQDRGALLARRYFHLIDEHSRRMAAKVVL
jgi:integrase